MHIYTIAHDILKQRLQRVSSVRTLQLLYIQDMNTYIHTHMMHTNGNSKITAHEGNAKVVIWSTLCNVCVNLPADCCRGGGEREREGGYRWGGKEESKM